MSALVCDICGGKLRITENRIAVCESCGMEHSLERMRQKYREAKEVVHVDNAHFSDNFMAIAQDSYDAGNLTEAERYCNKVLEVDPDNCDAHFLKGLAVGRQTTLAKPRIAEAALCCANAVNASSIVGAKEEFADKAERELRGFSTALVTMRCEKFTNFADADEASLFVDDIERLSTAISQYESATNTLLNRNYVFGEISSIVRPAISLMSVAILLHYSISGTKAAYQLLIKRTDSCISIIQKTADLCDDDNDSDVQLYELGISMLRALVDRNTEDQIRDKWGAYKRTPRLTASEIVSREEAIADFKQKKARASNHRN